MATQTRSLKSARVKIGTILDEKIVERLKERSHHERKSISAIIEEAVVRFDTAPNMDTALRIKALETVFALRFNVSNEAVRSIMDKDYYDQ